jgi:hypothetical protein
MLTWLTVAMLVTVTSAGVFSGERGRQTLDILLTLPMSGRQIVLDKVAGVRRLVLVCAIPLLTCVCFEAWWRDVLRDYADTYYRAQYRFIWWMYLPTAVSLVLTYLPLLSWLSIWIGLQTKSPTRATLVSLVVVVAWCILPLIVVLIGWELFRDPGMNSGIENHGFGMLLQLSPLGLLCQSEFDSIQRLSEIPFVPMLVNMLFYGSITLVLKYNVLSNADRLLGRSQPRRTWVLLPTSLGTQAPLTQVPSLAE